MNVVLDASAIVAYLRAETGRLVVRKYLEDPEVTCYAHAINLCEVYYQCVRFTNIKTARGLIATLYADGIVERRDMSRAFWRRVGNHKSRGRISLPDCCCLSLAQVLNAEIVTSDHHEFDPLVPLNIAPIVFIR